MDIIGLNNPRRQGRMLMVLPANLEMKDDEIILDGDFSHYLKFYLESFEKVVIACPAAKLGTFPTVASLGPMDQNDRLRIIVLPEPYREDRYMQSRRRVTSLLKEEIKNADFVVVAPHSAFDWPTLAAELCMQVQKPYNMEADWNLQQVNWSTWKKLPFGINKLRRYLWMRHHDPRYFRAMRNSNIALLHGRDVFDAYKNIAPNPHLVNNIRLAPGDHISDNILHAKIAHISTKLRLNIVFAGRAIGMKGPMEWLSTLCRLKELGVPFDATWFGAGEMLPQMKAFVDANQLNGHVTIAGQVARPIIFKALFRADIFMFCHLTRESPRNVVEALAAGVPIIGFGSPFSKHLVEIHGGGLFVETGDVEALAQAIMNLNNNRKELSALVSNAASSGRQFDRTVAITRRIELMKKYLLA